ncbi:distal tail protein Dit [Anoxybacillus sp. ST4]|uniref:distal tail protein Dit n=1 Tax=Anoxybacillus sp. ST4 TaxID=2864181 RepID=UPI001C63D41D|nr:distal tail protein Dit [Anoxybacillus sp. ST4]MBW7652166.1 phage tail family protein [Anoxybacillus sp. ST4]
MKYFVLDGKSSKDFSLRISHVSRSVLPEIRDHYEQIPGRHGSYLFPQPFGDRIVSVSCLLKTHEKSERMQTITRISAWLSSDRKRMLVFSDEPNVFYMGKVKSSPNFEEIFTFGKLTIEFVCDPFKYAMEAQEILFEMDSNSVQYISNGGTAETYPSVVIQAAYGEIQNPKITINDKYLLYNGILTPNSSIEINTESFLATKSMERDIVTTGAYDTAENNILSMIDGEFGALLPGGNTLAYSSANGRKARIRLVWQERYL